jgi:sec-independent protein translocase protein TatA
LGLSAQHLLLLLLVVVLLFGRGKISELMGDVAKGIKSFKKGMSDDDETAAAKQVPPRTIDNEPVNTDRTKTG